MGSDGDRSELRQWQFISIHASRVGSDPEKQGCRCRSRYFNPRFPRGKRHGVQHPDNPVLRISIHASRVGSDVDAMTKPLQQITFQSTLPAWEATAVRLSRSSRRCNFNPRFPRGKRRCRIRRPSRFAPISIHASRVGSDSSIPKSTPNFAIFQSTLPAWEATLRIPKLWHFLSISIHASRVGSDSSRRHRPRWRGSFQSTLPAWEATPPPAGYSSQMYISIHASRVGSDPKIFIKYGQK